MPLGNEISQKIFGLQLAREQKYPPSRAEQDISQIQNMFVEKPVSRSFDL